MANRLFIAFLLALLLGLLAWGGSWFLRNFERHSEEIRSGYSAAARRNPLLAAERFLRRLDMRVESLSGRGYLKQTPLQPGMLLVKDLGPSLPPRQQQALLDWVEAGGHLIASLARVPDEDLAGNRLLELLQVELVEVEDPDQEGSEPVEFALPGRDKTVRVGFEPSRVLRTEREDLLWRVSGNQGAHLLSLAWGGGRITLLSDNRFLNNSAIEQQDHALLLAWLARGHQRGWLLYSSQMPSLPVLAWRAAPQLILSGLLLGPMLIWWLTLRSGPILQRYDPPRRSLLEHLQAVAEFHWRRERGYALLLRTRRQLEQR